MYSSNLLSRLTVLLVQSQQQQTALQTNIDKQRADNTADALRKTGLEGEVKQLGTQFSKAQSEQNTITTAVNTQRASLDQVTTSIQQ